MPLAAAYRIACLTSASALGCCGQMMAAGDMFAAGFDVVAYW